MSEIKERIERRLKDEKKITYKLKRLFGLEPVEEFDIEKEERKYYKNPKISKEELLNGLMELSLQMREVKIDLKWMKMLIWAVFVYLFLKGIGVAP